MLNCVPMFVHVIEYAFSLVLPAFFSISPLEVGVCVCVRARERERERGKRKISSRLTTKILYLKTKPFIHIIR